MTEPTLLLAAVFCNDRAPDQSGAYVRVWNAGSGPLDLAKTVLEWDGARLLFPAGKSLPPAGSAYVAWQAEGFRRLYAREPDYTVGALVPVTKKAPGALRPAGGSVRLLSASGDVLDAFLWGTRKRLSGWNGPAATAAGPGAVYQRAIQEASLGPDSPGRFVTEVGTAAAWRQGTDWLPRRLVRAGQSELTYPTFALPGALLFVCPDSAFGVISQLIEGAARSLDINLYLITQTDLVERVIAAVQRGVAVRLLLEGEPYEGMPPSARDAIGRLQQAGAQVHVLHAAPDGFKRYHYDHAKYAVADGHRCLVMSDNWTNHSVPAEPVTGQRGWGAVLDSAPLAAHLTAIFAADANPASPDSELFVAGGPHLRARAGIAETGAVPADAPPVQVSPRPIANPVAPQQITGALQATVFTAPDHALLATRAICGMMRGAARTLDVLQDYIQLYWGYGEEGSVDSTPDLFLAEVVAAARRGVRVRVLLDGTYLKPEDPRDNSRTQQWLQALAAQEHLPIEARILDQGATAMSIHAKGLIVDGEQVLISSINWSENSPLENRELGLILASPAAAGYFGAVFERDWAGGV